MKKLIYAAMCSLSLCLYGCDYDDTDVWNAINGQEERIAALEEWQKTANENIAALQALVSGNDYITGVEALKEGDVEVGYVIHFYRQGDITIYHGEQGEKGDKGDQGDKGTKERKATRVSKVRREKPERPPLSVSPYRRTAIGTGP